MRLERFKAAIQSTQRATLLLLALLITSMASNLALGVLTIKLAGQQRTILVPPEIHKTFWVEASHVSGEYLEEMSYFLMQLILNVTPLSVESQSKLLLRYASAEAYGPLSTLMANSARRLKRDGASTLFNLRALDLNEKNLSVQVEGQLTTFISERRVAQTTKRYALEFEYSGGRIFLKTFKDISSHENVDPL